MTRPLAALGGLLLALTGCAGTVRLPATPSPPPIPPEEGLFRAGFGVTDITPPPGPGLFGYGPEGKRAAGFRQRLHARAMVLEDARGERVALVVVELGAVPELLQRRVAARLAERHPDALGLGHDRLFLAATHTHAGPGNIMGGVFDRNASTVAGHDPALVEFLVRGVVHAVEKAHLDRAPARIAWGVRPVWGLTRNRSFLPFQENEPPWTSPWSPPVGLPPTARAVDPELLLLRVDQRGGGGDYVPRGAFSLFAIHGTAVPSANTLYDADIHGIVARHVEAHIAGLRGEGNGAAGARVPVHLFANGASGDVSPAVPASTRCAVAEKRRGVPAFLGALFPAAGWAWREPDPGDQERCLQAALREMDILGRRLADEVNALFDSLQPVDSAITVDRAQVRLVPGEGERGLCADPQVGSATPGGVADGITRLHGHLGIREGRTDPEGQGCHAPKVPFLGWMQKVIAPGDEFPQGASFSALRIGDVLLGTIPGEVTTTAGVRMREAMRRGAEEAGWDPGRIALMTLTDGYLYYTATREEYGLQFYEGSSTLHGPGQAAAFAGVLEAQARDVATKHPGGAEVPQDRGAARPLDLAPGPGTRGGMAPGEPVPGDSPPHDPAQVRLPRIRSLLPPSRRVDPTDRTLTLGCDPDGHLVAEWLDLDPGRRLPRPGPWFRIVRDSRGGVPGNRIGEIVAGDGHPRVEVRMGEVEPTGTRWHLRYLDTEPGAVYRVVFPGGTGAHGVAGEGSGGGAGTGPPGSAAASVACPGSPGGRASQG